MDATALTLGTLIERGFADYSELRAAGIRKSFNLGINEFGLNERAIIDNELNQWDYMPEDQIYELRAQGPQAHLINNM